MRFQTRAVRAASAIVCLAVSPIGAHASVIVFGGEPTSTVEGYAKVLDLPSLDEENGYAQSSVGTNFLSAPVSDSVSGSVNLAGGDLDSSANASYSMTLGTDGLGSATGGSMVFGASASVLLSSGIATDPGDWAFSRARAETRAFLDFTITGAAVSLAVSGSLLDETLDNGSGDLDDALFYLADTTASPVFTFLIQHADVRGDATPTTFSDQVLLLPGRNYRMTLSTRVDHVCARTAGAPQPVCQAATALLGPGGSTISQAASGSVDFTFTPIPEPSTALLLGLGLVALGLRASEANSSRR